MKQDSSTISWNNLGSEWFELATTAESRMLFIMPYTLAKLGDVEGKKILDLGCGEGGYSRALAQRQAQMVSIDCSEQAIKYASEQAIISGLFIEDYVRNSNDLFGIANDD